MFEAIGPGTPLICVRWEPQIDWYAEGVENLTVGALYTVRKLAPRPFGTFCSECGNPSDGVKLCEKPPTSNYCICLFRPLNDGDTSLLKDEIPESIDSILVVERLANV